jgi:UDP-galactopyranose mutase
LVEEKSLLSRYVGRAREEERTSFVGRLGTYRYLDMHVAIAEALDVARSFIAFHRSDREVPAFFVDPI